MFPSLAWRYIAPFTSDIFWPNVQHYSTKACYYVYCIQPLSGFKMSYIQMLHVSYILKRKHKEHVLLFPLFCCACVFVFCPFVENGPIVDITQMLDDPLGLEKSEALMLMPPQTWRCCVLSRPLNLGVKNLWTLLMPVKMWFAIVCTFVPHWQKHCHLLYILKSGLL